MDLAQDLGLTQTVADPTRGDNILDLFFTNYVNFINKTSVISGVSDYEAVTIESKLSLNPKKQFLGKNNFGIRLILKKLKQTL